MAIVQISKIQQRSGNLVDLPQLDEAEFGWASDAKRLFIGKTTPNENIEVLTAYSNIAFSQIDGSVGNLNISALTAADGQVLAFDGDNWVNRGGIAGGLLTLGNIANVKIDGGGGGFVLQTDGAGNLSWAPKNAVVANIMTVTKANPAVVTTVDENFFANGAQVTITNAQGMTQLNGNTYTVTLISANSFSIGVDSSAYTAYAYTSVTNTTVSTNLITVGDSTVLTLNQPVKFVGNVTSTGLLNNTTYYVLSKPSSTQIKVATSADGNTSNVVPLQTVNGLTANVYQTGGRGIATFGSGGTLAGGTNTQVQYSNTGLLDGSSDFTFDFSSTPKLLTLNGNANISNVNVSGVVTSTRFISNVATGTTPIQVTSTTRVSNLNVSYANVSDYGVVTAQNTGTFYPVFVSGNTSANYALASNANISFNAATGLLTTSTISVTGNANVGNLGTAGQVVATGNVTGGNLVTAGALSVTGNASVGNLDTTGNITGANVTGNLYGNGAAISEITGANVTGEVDFAAVANSVALANVVGIGNIADINIDGSSTHVLYGNGTFASINEIYGNSNVAAFLAAFGSNTLITTGNANVGNLNAASSVIATGNITGGNLTTAGQVVATGNITGGNLTTGGKLSVTGDANVSGNINVTGNIAASSNVTVIGNTNITANLTANNIATGSNANVGLDLNVSGNVNVTGNAAITGNIDTTGNVSAKYLTLANNANITGNISVSGNSSVIGNSNVSGKLTTTTASVTGNLDAGNVVVSGNIIAGNANLGNAVTANYFLGDGGLLSNVNLGPFSYIENGTSNVVVDNDGPVRISASSTDNVIMVYGAGANIWGYANVSGNITAGNASVSGVVAATGNVSGGNVNAVYKVVASTLTSNVATGTSPLTVTSTTRVANLNVANAGYADNAGNAVTAVSATTAGTVTTAAQPNITSVGTLTGLTVSSTITGSVSGSAGSATTAGTVTTAAQPNITNVGTLTSLSVSGAVNSGPITATGNVSGANFSTSGSLGVSGSATITGNAAVGGNISATGTAHSLSGNVTVGNLSATGNILASNVNGTTGSFTTVNTTNAKFANLRDNSNYLITKFDNDGTMAANSASYLPTQQAVVEYVANNATPGIGYNQTWQQFANSRSLGNTFTNSTGKPIMVFVKVSWPYGFDAELFAQVGNVDVAFFSAHTDTAAVNFLVPVGGTYKVYASSNVTATLQRWNELR